MDFTGTEWFLLFVFGIVCGSFTFTVADAKHLDSPQGWFWAGFFFAPVGLIAVIGMPEKELKPEEPKSPTEAQ